MCKFLHEIALLLNTKGRSRSLLLRRDRDGLREAGGERDVESRLETAERAGDGAVASKEESGQVPGKRAAKCLARERP
eukprot:1581728-Pleurochrysis_carterae.AAC.1